MERTDTDQRTVASRTTTGIPKPSRYDYALGVIPILLGLPTMSAFLAGLPFEPLVAAGALAAALVVADVVYFHPPVDVDATSDRGERGGSPE